jgi:hypothetical protein
MFMIDLQTTFQKASYPFCVCAIFILTFYKILHEQKCLIFEDIYNMQGHAVAYCLRHYATSQKVVGSIPDEVTEFFFSVYLILLVTLGPGIHSASNRNEYQKQNKNVSGDQSAAGA